MRGVRLWRIARNDNVTAFNAFVLGIIYGKMGRLEKAIDLFREALDIKPDDTITLLNLGFAYEQLAKSYELRAVSNEPRAISRELRVKAIETYQKILEIDHDNIQAKDRVTKLRALSNEQ